MVTGYEIERELAAAGMTAIAGVDEVGRGAWAGPHQGQPTHPNSLGAEQIGVFGTTL